MVVTRAAVGGKKWMKAVKGEDREWRKYSSDGGWCVVDFLPAERKILIRALNFISGADFSKSFPAKECGENIRRKLCLTVG